MPSSRPPRTPMRTRRRLGPGESHDDRRIEFPQFWEHRRIEYPLPPAELPCGCCGTQRIIIRTHVTKRVEMEEAKLYVVEEVRYTYGCSALPRWLADADHAEAAAGRGEKPLRAEHPGLAGDLEVPAPLAGLSAAGTAAGSAETMVVAGIVVRAVETDGPGFAASGAIDSPAGARQRRHQRRRNGGADAQAGARQGDHGLPQRLCRGCGPSLRVL